MTYLTSIVEKAWKEAVARPDYARWNSLADLAKGLADSLQQLNPDDISVIAHRAIYHEARKRMLAMEPARETV